MPVRDQLSRRDRNRLENGAETTGGNHCRRDPRVWLGGSRSRRVAQRSTLHLRITVPRAKRAKSRQTAQAFLAAAPAPRTTAVGHPPRHAPGPTVAGPRQELTKGRCGAGRLGGRAPLWLRRSLVRRQERGRIISHPFPPLPRRSRARTILFPRRCVNRRMLRKTI